MLDQEVTKLHELLKVLGNKGRLQVLLYLKKSGVATGAIIAKNLGMNRSVVCRYLKDLVRVNLVIREKCFKMTVFKANSVMWEILSQLMVRQD